MGRTERLIFHVDVNSAFLSWEAARRVKEGLPDLRLIPSAVGGDAGSRTGIITAKSIPAKRYGVTTGEPVSMALRKCPGLVLVKADFDLYRKSSAAFKAICQEYTPAMESFSIDEVFLDMSGMELIFPDPLRTACEIKDRIREELGFTVNIGIGSNKLLAKMASDFEKPDRVHTLFENEIREKMWPLPAENLLFLGKASAAALSVCGIRTIGELAAADGKVIRKILGEKGGRLLQEYARGIDDSPVCPVKEEAKGYSTEMTFNEDVVSYEQAFPVLLKQADSVSARMRRDGKLCTCISVTVRNTAFATHSHQMKLYNATDVSDEIYETAKQLFSRLWNGEPLRLIGLSLTGLTADGYAQLSLFESSEDHEKRQKLDRALDSIREKYGKNSVGRLGISGSGKMPDREEAGMLSGQTVLPEGKERRTSGYLQNPGENRQK